MESNTSERLKYIMNLYNITQADIVAKTNIPKSAISQYVSGKREPRQDRLYLLGKALDVDEAWLMGFDVPMQRKHALDDLATLTNRIRNDSNAQDLLHIYYNKLNSENQKRLIEIARGLGGL